MQVEPPPRMCSKKFNRGGGLGSETNSPHTISQNSVFIWPEYERPRAGQTPKKQMAAASTLLTSGSAAGQRH